MGGPSIHLPYGFQHACVDCSFACSIADERRRALDFMRGTTDGNTFGNTAKDNTSPSSSAEQFFLPFPEATHFNMVHICEQTIRIDSKGNSREATVRTHRSQPKERVNEQG